MPHRRQDKETTKRQTVRRDLAQKSVLEALRQAKTIRERDVRGVLIGETAETMVATGLIFEAVQTARTLDVQVRDLGFGRFEVMARIAIGMADQRAFSAALQTAAEIVPPKGEVQVLAFGKADTFAAIAERCAKDGNFPLALRAAALAQQSESLDDREGEAYHRIAPEQARRGDVDAAFRSMDAIRNGGRIEREIAISLEAKALGEVSAILKRRNSPSDLERCDARLQKTLESTANAEARDDILSTYISARAKEGDPDGALALVQRIAGSAPRETALQAIVEGASRLRRFPVSQQALGQIRTPQIRGAALVALAEAYVESGDLAEARSILDKSDREGGQEFAARLQLRAKMGDSTGWFATLDRRRNRPDGRRTFEESTEFMFAVIELVQAGQMDPAEKAIALMPPVPAPYPNFVLTRSAEIAELWSAVAIARLQKGDRDGASRCVEKAKKASQMAIGEYYPRALLLLGDVAGAVRVVDAFSRYPSRFPELMLGGALFALMQGMSVRKLTYELIRDDHEPDARRFVEKLTSPALRVYGYLGITDGFLGRPKS